MATGGRRWSIHACIATGACPRRADSLTYDPYTDELLGAGYFTLFTVSRPYGQTTSVGDIGHYGDGIALDPFNSVLYGTGWDGLYTIDRATGVGTLLAPSLGFEGLAMVHSPDCNLNRVPDPGDIADQPSFDCNDNAVPDECPGPSADDCECRVGDDPCCGG